MYDLHNWAGFFKQPAIFAEPRKILEPGDAVFTIGSCFALEVRKAVAARGYKTYPDYVGIGLEPKTEMFDAIPLRDMTAHYDTFTMRQEFEAAFGEWPDREVGYWKISGTRANELMKIGELFQDPYRKSTFSVSPEKLAALSDRVTKAIREGLDRAKVVVITLGLTEVWQHNASGRYICRPPGSGNGGGQGLATFKASKFRENYENVKAMLDMLFARYPEKQVVLSVSPVRLERTYTNYDVGTANLESKSILRAVAGQISEEYAARVLYFPSYEMAMAGIGGITGTGNVFMADGRHVEPSFVQTVTNSFVKLVS